MKIHYVHKNTQDQIRTMLLKGLSSSWTEVGRTKVDKAQ